MKLKTQFVKTIWQKWQIKMAAFYASEQFPRCVVELLRALNHDILTVQEAENRGLSDEKVVAFAISKKRAVLTLNRKNFIKLHRLSSEHSGIIVCSRDDNWLRQANGIRQIVAELGNLDGLLLRVNKPG